jgi:hypothetical protein
MTDLVRRLRGLAKRGLPDDVRLIMLEAATEIDGLTHDVGKALDGLTVEALDRDRWKERATTAIRERDRARHEREEMRVDRFNECEALREQLRDARRKGL